MGIWGRLGQMFSGANPVRAPKASVADGGVLITSSEELEEALRSGMTTASGANVSDTSAMRVAAVFACVRIISGGVANLPLHIKQRIDNRTREDASDHPLWNVLRRKPNRWQTPSQFRRLLTVWLLLRGNAYAQIVRSRGRVIALNPLHPDRMEVTQRDDLGLDYFYTRKDGRRVQLDQDEVFHLVGMSLDGITGVSVIKFARETIGLALAQERHGATTFKNGARTSNALVHPNQLGPDGTENLRASLDSFRAGGENEGKWLILEEGTDIKTMSMTSEDAQWIESRKFSRGDIAMFFGVPPHMIGDTEKSTSWGSGIDQQTIGFQTWTQEDHLTCWEEAIGLRLISDDEPDIYARFNRAASVKSDIKTRWAAYALGRQMQVYSANDVRALEDMNPIEGGDVYDNPSITVTDKEERDEPAQTA